MDNKNKIANYLDINIPKHVVIDILKTNNIDFNRLEVYYDFIYDLDRKIMRTYLGDQYLNGTQRVEHFNYAFNKVNEKYKKYNIDYYYNSELYSYFLEFYTSYFYNIEDKKDKEGTLNKLHLVWGKLFDINSDKTRGDIDTLITLYYIFNISLEI